jgi:hypothetical protein
VVATVEDDHDNTHGEEDVTKVPSEVLGPRNDHSAESSGRQGVEVDLVREQVANDKVRDTSSGEDSDVARTVSWE